MTTQPKRAHPKRKDDGALTDKEELFCQGVVELGNASAAYRRAYNVKPTTKTESINTRASELMAVRKIRVRVDELRVGLQERNKITMDVLVEMMVSTHNLAMAKEQPTTAMDIVMNLAKLTGHYVERQIVKSDQTLEYGPNRLKVEGDARQRGMELLEKLGLTIINATSGQGAADDGANEFPILRSVQRGTGNGHAN